MQLPSAIATGSIAIALFAGGFAIGHGVSDDSGSNSNKTQVAGKVFAKTEEPTTTTTTPAPQAPPTSQAPAAAAPAPTATTAPQATATVLNTTTASTTAPVTTPATVVVVNSDCGSGTADAHLSSQTQPKERSANTDYQTDIAVDVNNRLNKPIQLDSLSVRITTTDGRVYDVVFNSAPGTVIQPGNTGRFTTSVNTGKTPAQTLDLTSFAFHTAGHPECPGRAA